MKELPTNNWRVEPAISRHGRNGGFFVWPTSLKSPALKGPWRISADSPEEAKERLFQTLQGSLKNHPLPKK